MGRTAMNTMRKNIDEAVFELTSRPLFAVSTERVMILDRIKSLYKDLPQPLRFSKFMSVLLSEVSTPLEEYDLIAGRCVFDTLDEDGEKLFAEFMNSPDHPNRLVMLGSGHCTYSWDMVIDEGLVGMKKMAEDSLLGLSENETDKRDFLRSTIEIYGAISDYMLRYADAAQERGLTSLAKNLRDGATKRPDSFVCALQLLWIIALIDCAYITPNPTLTLGRLDKILYPLYKKDIESGALTRDEAKRVIIDYYCKHNLIMGRGEHQVGDESNSTTFSRILNFDAPQYLLLCGTQGDGEPVCNELSQLFAECIVPSFKNPVVVVRYFENMDKHAPLLWKTLSEKALESSALMFYNDVGVTKTLENIGMKSSEAREYAHFGCNWCSTGDNGAWIAGGPSADSFFYDATPAERRALQYAYRRTNAGYGWAEDFMISLKELSKMEAKAQSIEALYGIFFGRMSEFLDKKIAEMSEQVRMRKKRPSAVITFGDCFYRESLKSAECFAAGAKYHFEIHGFQMFGTVADCFWTVEKLVFDEKKLTVDELIAATEADFAGYEDVLALCRSVDKYGSDSEETNRHAERLARTSAELAIEKSRPYFEREGLFLMPSIQSDTWHLKYGEQYGATVDGRRAGKAFSQNTDPAHGAAVNGLTAILNSVRSIPKGCAVSGALNVSVDKKQFRGERGIELFAAILGTYFDLGGLHAQVSSVDADKLREAQLDPDAHKDIRVRITGYSGVFVDVCKRLQDDIIERFE